MLRKVKGVLVGVTSVCAMFWGNLVMAATPIVDTSSVEGTVTQGTTDLVSWYLVILALLVTALVLKKFSRITNKN